MATKSQSWEIMMDKGDSLSLQPIHRDGAPFLFALLFFEIEKSVPARA
jgi:hypothetical protein